MDAKKVLIVYLGKNGGPSAFTYELACGFSLCGHQVYALLSDANEMKLSWEKQKKINKIYIYTGNTRKIVSASIKMEIKTRRFLRKQYCNTEFDYVIYTMPHPWSYRIGSAFRSKKHVMFCHDPIAHSSAWQVYRIINDYLLKKCDDIFVLTKSFVPVIEERFHVPKEHIHYVPHGTMSIYGKDVCGTVPQHNVTGVNFIFFGNITGYKGLNVLGKAYRELCLDKELKTDFTLTIAGRGDFSPFASEYEGLPNIQLENRFIPDAEVASIFRKPNAVLILPYLDATQSGVIPIAMEFGVPVIASDTGGLREQLDNGNIGVLFECANANALAEAMKSMIKHPGLMAEQRDKMKGYLVRLNWDNIAASMVEQLEAFPNDRE